MMKRYTKKKILKARTCTRHDHLIDEYFDKHKTISLMTIFNSESLSDHDKVYMLLGLDKELFDLAGESVSMYDDGEHFYAQLIDSTKKILKNEKEKV